MLFNKHKPYYPVNAVIKRASQVGSGNNRKLFPLFCNRDVPILKRLHHLPPFRTDSLKCHCLLAFVTVVVIYKRAVQPHERSGAIVNQLDGQAVVQECIHVDVRSEGMETVGVFLNKTAVGITATRLTGTRQQTS